MKKLKLLLFLFTFLLGAVGVFAQTAVYATYDIGGPGHEENAYIGTPGVWYVGCYGDATAVQEADGLKTNSATGFLVSASLRLPTSLTAAELAAEPVLDHIYTGTSAVAVGINFYTDPNALDPTSWWSWISTRWSGIGAPGTAYWSYKNIDGTLAFPTQPQVNSKTWAEAIAELAASGLSVSVINVSVGNAGGGGDPTEALVKSLTMGSMSYKLATVPFADAAAEIISAKGNQVSCVDLGLSSTNTITTFEEIEFGVTHPTVDLADVTFRIEFVSGQDIVKNTGTLPIGDNKWTPEPLDNPLGGAGTVGKGVYQAVPIYNNIEGNPVTFSLETRPVLAAEFVGQTDLVYNNGDIVQAIDLAANLPEGALLRWSPSSTDIGIASEGFATIYGFTARNTTPLPLDVDVDFIIYYSDFLGCTAEGSFKITVNPKTIGNLDLIADVDLKDQVTCYDVGGFLTVDYIENFAQMEFSAADAIDGDVTPDTKFRIEFVSGENIVDNLETLAAGSNTWTPNAVRIGKGVYRAVPIYNNDEGIAITFSLEVRQILINTLISYSGGTLVYQNGDAVPTIDLTSSLPAGTAVMWTLGGDPIGIGSLGAGNIPGFIAQNNTALPITCTIEYTIGYLDFKGCRDMGQFDIIVNPKTIGDLDLAMAPVANQTICYEDDFVDIDFVATHNFDATFDNDDVTFTVEFVGGVNVLDLDATNNSTIAAAWVVPVPTTKIVGTGTYRVTPKWNNNEGKSAIFTLTVQPELLAANLIQAGQTMTVQNGDQIYDIIFTGAIPAGTIVTWERDAASDAIGSMELGVGHIPAFTAINTTGAPITADYVLELALAGCASTDLTPVTFSITVNPKTIGDLDLVMDPVANQTICYEGKFVDIDFVAAHNFDATFDNDDVTFTVEFVGGVNVLDLNATNNSTIAAAWVVPVPTTKIVGTGTYRVTPKWNNNEGQSAIFTLTVQLELLAADLALAGQTMTVQNGDQVYDITFTGAIPAGAIVTWVHSGDAIGSLLSGANTIPAFKAINTTNAPITAVYTLELALTGCVSTDLTSVEFKITVNPALVANLDLTMEPIENQSVCFDEDFVNATLTANHKFVNIAAANLISGDITFFWELIDGVNIMDGVAQGYIPAPITTNTEAWSLASSLTPKKVGTGTYRVTPIWANNKGASIEFTLTRLPEAQVNPINDVVLCNESPLNVNFTSVNGNKATYKWVLVDASNAPLASSALGIPLNGNGNISVASLRNTTTAAITERIEVTPQVVGDKVCDGTPVYFTVTVLPTPSVNVINNVTLTPGQTLTAIQIPITGTATSYKWESSNSAISTNPAAMVSGTITTIPAYFPVFTAQNTVQTPVESVITVTPIFTDASGLTCYGEPTKFSIIVMPTLVISAINNVTLCEGDASQPIIPNGLPTGSNYYIKWTGGATVGLANSPTTAPGTNYRIPSFTATAIAGTITTATVTVTPYIYYGTTEYAGTPVTFTITVAPSVVITTATAETAPDVRLDICENDPTSMNVVVTGTAPVTYQWYKKGSPIPGATNAIYNIAAVGLGDAGDYHCVVTGGCDEKKSRTYIVTTRVAVLKQSWDNVIVLINNPRDNGGFEFSNISWYEVGSGGVLTLIPNENKSYLVETRANGVVGRTYLMTATDQYGVSYQSCPITGVPAQELAITIYPNPVKASALFNVNVDASVTVTNMRLQMVNLKGSTERTLFLQNGANEIQAPDQPGTYIINILNGANKVREYKVIVN